MTGHWHGKNRYFGLHYDFHAGKADKAIGTGCPPEKLAEWIKLSGCDFAQTDTKGHAGYTSWFSKVKTASVSPGVKKDALKAWREATRRLKMPLHCHYSGIWDAAAGAKFKRFCVVKADGTLNRDKMCPRGPYLRELLIPHFLELIDRYGVDGFWVDGDYWSVEPCYCKTCRAAFKAKTGNANPPKEKSEAGWSEWMSFHREGFEAYATAYCDAVHRHKAGVLVCSNWLQTFKHPGEPKVPTDWISGDNTHIWGMDGSRCEARFISTRGKPWDIMLWNFYCSHGSGKPDAPWIAKPVQMVQQEAAITLAFGGNVQVYENPGLRDGRLAAWRQRRVGEVARFAHARRALCQGTETIPQLAVLHSEHHLYSRYSGNNLMFHTDARPVMGATFSLLETHYGVDILDEWALRPRLRDFPVVVAPEQDRMSEGMVADLKRYVENGGRLLVTGAAAFERFGGEFLGVRSTKIVEKQSFFVPAEEGMAPLYSESWRLLRLVGARSLGRLGKTLLPDQDLLPHPAATLHRVGRGAVAYIPGDVFRCFDRNRYPMIRHFVSQVARSLSGKMDYEMEGPRCLDMILRRNKGKVIAHLVNLASGLPNQPNAGAVDEIPPVGPVSIEIRLPVRPRRVTVAFEKTPLRWSWSKGWVHAKLERVRLHAGLVVA